MIQKSLNIIDLSHIIEPGMQVYPGTKPPLISEVHSFKHDGFKESCFTFYSHIGTHIDLPAHIFEIGKSVESFDCSKFFGTAMVIDCRDKVSIEPENILGVIKKSILPEFILLNTGFSEKWGYEKYLENFPVLSKDAALYLASLSIKGVGIDAISFDGMDDPELTNHHILLGKEILLIENLKNLNQLPDGEFYFSCLPLNISGAEGAPTRSFAII
jgi:arylformamidase